VVCASSSLRAVLQATYPGSASMLEVVTPGVDAVSGSASDSQRAQAREQLGLPTEAALLLFVGNDFVKKGLPALLQALTQLPAHTQLAVVGNAESNSAMRQLAEQLGLAARVHFLGSQRDMVTAYQAADALVHPTLEDAYGMVVLEAMAHGLPVVVSDAPYSGIAQDLQDGENALLLKDPRDVSEIAAALQRLQTDVDLEMGLSIRAKAFAQAHSWERTASGYEAMYTKITKRYAQRWLVLSHAFNMDGRAASQTITDKLPHLDAAGIELVVLSGVSGQLDRQYEHHQLWPAGPAGIRFEMRHVLRKHLTAAWLYRLVMVLLSIPLLPFMLIEKLLKPVESSWSWWLTAYIKGLWLARNRKFDLIYSTGGAYAAHVAGMRLKRALGVRWLAEVHDPLVTPGREGAADLSAQEQLQAQVEYWICAGADVAIWFTEQALASAKRRNPMLDERGRVMLPGIDAPIASLPTYVPGPKMVVGHFGSLSATRNLVPFLRGLELLVAKRPEAKEKLELQLTGGPLDTVSQAYLGKSPVQGMLRQLGRIEANPITGQSGRVQILSRMRGADVLLLLHGEEPICAEYIPSKLYEYLWMQRPILATVYQNSQMEQLLLNQGHVVARGDHGIAVALETFFDLWQARQLSDSGCISPYTTRAAAHNLMEWAS
jgi:glycosyltransferase involved in cell wall biosynthesis